VQPLIVRERGGFFELIAGERRWRAAQLLQLAEVPVIAREADDRAVLELALIEISSAKISTPSRRRTVTNNCRAVPAHAGGNCRQGRQKPRGGGQCNAAC